MYEIKTSNYKKTRSVRIDDFDATITAMGAGSELQFSQMNRRLNFLGKKAEAGTITETELDRMDELESQMLDYFGAIIKDDTEGNTKVKAWLQATPLEIIQKAFEDMQAQFKETDKAGDGGKELPTAQA